MHRPSMRDVVEAVLGEIVREKTPLRPLRPVVVTGVGSHQQVVARSVAALPNLGATFITSAGHGTMGFGLPAAIGAALEADRRKHVVLFNGDGSAVMDMPSLVSAVEFGLRNLRVVILDNESYGIVQQFEELQGFSTKCTADRLNPNFADLASACGWPTTIEYRCGQGRGRR